MLLTFAIDGHIRGTGLVESGLSGSFEERGFVVRTTRTEQVHGSGIIRGQLTRTIRGSGTIRGQFPGTIRRPGTTRGTGLGGGSEEREAAEGEEGHGDGSRADGDRDLLSGDEEDRTRGFLDGEGRDGRHCPNPFCHMPIGRGAAHCSECRSNRNQAKIYAKEMNVPVADYWQSVAPETRNERVKRVVASSDQMSTYEFRKGELQVFWEITTNLDVQSSTLSTIGPGPRGVLISTKLHGIYAPENLGRIVVLHRKSPETGRSRALARWAFIPGARVDFYDQVLVSGLMNAISDMLSPSEFERPSSFKTVRCSFGRSTCIPYIDNGWAKIHNALTSVSLLLALGVLNVSLILLAVAVALVDVSFTVSRIEGRSREVRQLTRSASKELALVLSNAISKERRSVELL
jgi:hypothetical protein